jgi:uncharacterized membrane protein
MNGASAEGVGAHETDPRAVRLRGVIAGIRDRVWTLTVWGALLVWAGALFLVVRDRYADFRFGRYDLGNMVQAVWSTAHGRPLEVTDGATGEQIVRLGRHADPILAALAPLWIAVPSPLTLAGLQILAVALGALPVFWLGRRHTGSDRTAALIALAYLAYPWVAWTALDAFHPVTLAIPLLLFGIWFLDGDRIVPFAICAALVATTGELMGFVIAALGIWYAVARRRTQAGVVITVAGIAASFVALYVVVPAFSGGPSVYYGPFDDVGGSPQGLIRTALSEPTAIVSAVSEGRDLLYLVLLSAPLAGAFLLSPGLAAVALPQLAVNLLADDPGTTDPHEHYVAAVVPFLFAAIAIGLGRLAESNRMRVALLVLVLSIAPAIAVGPWPGTLLGASTWGPLPTSPVHVETLKRAVDLVPDDAAVSGTNRAGSHLAERRYFYSVPVLGRATWIVIETEDTWVPAAVSGSSRPAVLRRFQREIEGNPEWRKVFDRQGVLVFRKVER